MRNVPVSTEAGIECHAARRGELRPILQAHAALWGGCDGRLRQLVDMSSQFACIVMSWVAGLMAVVAVGSTIVLESCPWLLRVAR